MCLSDSFKFSVTLRSEGVGPPGSPVPCSACRGPPRPQTAALRSQMTKSQVDLLVQGDRGGVIVGRSLQLLPACLCRRSWWRVLRWVLDAHTGSRFPDLLLWQIWLPVFTSYSRLGSREENQVQSW